MGDTTNLVPTSNIAVKGNIHLSPLPPPGAGPRETLLRILEPHVARHGMHDSEVVGSLLFHGCAPKTRVTVRQEIVGWLEIDGSDRVLWLTGPAGAGKSAIARSIASPPDDEEKDPEGQCYHLVDGSLAAAFFFSCIGPQLEETSSKKYLVPTLAYQLFQHLGAMVAEQALRNYRADPLIFEKSLRSQFRTLILDPLSHLSQEERFSIPKLLIVDGVNEVGSGLGRRRDLDDQDEILNTLLAAAADPFFPFRLLISSRREANISNALSHSAPGVNIVKREIELNEKYKPNIDIRRYLQKGLERIHRKLHHHNGGVQWPQDNILDELVENSSGHFAYPAAIIRYVENGLGEDGASASPEAGSGGGPAARGKDDTPRARLERVLTYQPKRTGDGSNIEAFVYLDCFFAGVINDCVIGSAETKFKWLRAISRRPALPAWFWRRYLALSEDPDSTARDILQGLDSLILIPRDDDRDKPYHFYHKTFLDFLSREEGRKCPPGSQARTLKDGHFYFLDFPPNFDCRSKVSEFLQRCFLETLKKYGPDAEPVSEDDGTWVSLFLSAIESVQPVFDEAQHCPKRDFVLCRMDWWMTRIVTQGVCNPSIVNQLFQFIHHPCPWYHCTKACRPWRKDILKACKRHGWSTPGAWVLLRNWFIRSEEVDGVHYGYPPEWHFSPPARSRGTGLKVD